MPAASVGIAQAKSSADVIQNHPTADNWSLLTYAVASASRRLEKLRARLANPLLRQPPPFM